MVNLKDLENIIALLEKTDISEIDLQEADHRIRIVRGGGSAPHFHAASYAPAATVEPPADKAEATAETPPEKGNVVLSPFVGTFYRAPSPESPNYVEIGSTVGKGQTLCIVEAMKLMNEIESEYAGRVTQIFVENGQPVEYGEKLFLIEEA